MKAPRCLLAVLAAGLATGSIAGAQTLQKVADSSLITVSYREASVPFSYLAAPGRPVGFAVDLTEAIVADVRARLGRPDIKVAYVPVTGQNRIPDLVSGRYDLECGSTTNTAARGKEVAFAISHFYAGTRLLTREGAGIGSFKDLKGKVVSTVAGSTNEKVLRAYSDENHLDVTIAPAKDYGETLQALISDRASAVALDDVLLYGLRANSENPTQLVVVGETLQVEPYGCMVRKDDPEFKALVDTTLTRLMQSGEFARLYAKWFESPIPPNNVNLAMPMSERLKTNLTERSDKPVQ